jgi:hypothetical protein
MGFDPVLGDLGVVTEPGAAAALLAARVPGLAVRSARRQDTKYRPLERCVATYELDLAGGERTIGVVTVTAEGAGARLLDDDPDLPALAEALDPDRMAARLAGPVPGLERCQPVPVRYKPGVRCVVRYELGTRAGPRQLYGKLMAGGVDAQLATIAALRAAADADPAMPAVLPVTAAWPDLGMLAQPAVEHGAELNERAFDPAVPEADRARWLRAAGRCLAALHGNQAAPPGAPAAGPAGDLAELRGYLGPVGQVDPALADRYRAALALVEAAGRATPAQAPATGHGAMRTDQFLIGADGRMVLIDLDGVCLAEPARDLGNLLAYLDWKAIRRPAAAELVERAGDAFMAGYAGRLPVSGERVAVHRAGSLLKIAGRRYRSLTVPEWPLVPRLVEAAAGLLGAGARRTKPGRRLPA